MPRPPALCFTSRLLRTRQAWRHHRSSSGCSCPPPRCISRPQVASLRSRFCPVLSLPISVSTTLLPGTRDNTGCDVQPSGFIIAVLLSSPAISQICRRTSRVAVSLRARSFIVPLSANPISDDGRPSYPEIDEGCSDPQTCVVLRCIDPLDMLVLLKRTLAVLRDTCRRQRHHLRPRRTSPSRDRPSPPRPSSPRRTTPSPRYQGSSSRR
mmetsp:Transcript_154167/g.493109  ORF Transcript_154167/g.493109 Transcript_154167/m.493109 type:complete len:210 (+) Transcript_154167:929-1558(+)